MLVYRVPTRGCACPGLSSGPLENRFPVCHFTHLSPRMQLGGGGDSLAHVGVCTPTPSPLKPSSGPKAGAQELLHCSLESPGSSQSSLRRSVLGFQVLNIAQKALGLAWLTQQLAGDVSNRLNQEGKMRPLLKSPWGVRQHLNGATLVLSFPPPLPLPGPDLSFRHGFYPFSASSPIPHFPSYRRPRHQWVQSPSHLLSTQ